MIPTPFEQYRVAPPGHTVCIPLQPCGTIHGPCRGSLWCSGPGNFPTVLLFAVKLLVKLPSPPPLPKNMVSSQRAVSLHVTRASNVLLRSLTARNFLPQLQFADSFSTARSNLGQCYTSHLRNLPAAHAAGSLPAGRCRLSRAETASLVTVLCMLTTTWLGILQVAIRPFSSCCSYRECPCSSWRHLS